MSASLKKEVTCNIPKPNQCTRQIKTIMAIIYAHTSSSYTVFFLHSQHLTHGMRCKQTDAGSKAREVDSGTHAGYPHHSCSHLKRCFPVAVFLPVCRQLAARRPPVYICLTASREPGPSSALSIRELSPAGSPHRCCAYWQKDIRLHCVV